MKNPFKTIFYVVFVIGFLLQAQPSLAMKRKEPEPDDSSNMLVTSVVAAAGFIRGAMNAISSLLAAESRVQVGERVPVIEADDYDPDNNEQPQIGPSIPTQPLELGPILDLSVNNGEEEPVQETVLQVGNAVRSNALQAGLMNIHFQNNNLSWSDLPNEVLKAIFEYLGKKDHDQILFVNHRCCDMIAWFRNPLILSGLNRGYLTKIGRIQLRGEVWKRAEQGNQAYFVTENKEAEAEPQYDFHAIDRETSKVLYTITLPGIPYNLAVSGNYACIPIRDEREGGGALVVIDLDEHEVARKISHHRVPGRVFLYNDKAYLVESDGISIFNLSDGESEPGIGGFFCTFENWPVIIQNEIAYVETVDTYWNRLNGLCAIDLRNGTLETEIDIPWMSYVNKPFMRDGLIYLGAHGTRLVCIIDTASNKVIRIAGPVRLHDYIPFVVCEQGLLGTYTQPFCGSKILLLKHGSTSKDLTLKFPDEMRVPLCAPIVKNGKAYVIVERSECDEWDDKQRLAIVDIQRMEITKLIEVGPDSFQPVQYGHLLIVGDKGLKSILFFDLNTEKTTSRDFTQAIDQPFVFGNKLYVPIKDGFEVIDLSDCE